MILGDHADNLILEADKQLKHAKFYRTPLVGYAQIEYKGQNRCLNETGQTLVYFKRSVPQAPDQRANQLREGETVIASSDWMLSKMDPSCVCSTKWSKWNLWENLKARERICANERKYLPLLCSKFKNS